MLSLLDHELKSLEKLNEILNTELIFFTFIFNHVYLIRLLFIVLLLFYLTIYY